MLYEGKPFGDEGSLGEEMFVKMENVMEKKVQLEMFVGVFFGNFIRGFLENCCDELGQPFSLRGQLWSLDATLDQVVECWSFSGQFGNIFSDVMNQRSIQKPFDNGGHFQVNAVNSTADIPTFVVFRSIPYQFPKIGRFQVNKVNSITTCPLLDVFKSTPYQYLQTSSFPGQLHINIPKVGHFQVNDFNFLITTPTSAVFRSPSQKNVQLSILKLQ
ncbi:unnamed protein product [Allacma fusca]|uniref:Uncharacterized protein n=1 Tax=Allacma fusca TaxID=39272 RepID=A0A8J2LL85_9HEXA|nr:unnamed protein product [Allacma fusca]